ncbi:MAG: F0F1 ATP synthase subunit B [Deltaproteobacteria bacterium]|nr:F0F1 ATP synthase subunit B [Deltaproteobacteria bacterium]
MSRKEYCFGFGILVGILVLLGGYTLLWASSGGSGGFSREVFWQMVSFVFLIVLLTYVLKKPLRSFLLKRREEIQNSLEQAAQKEEKSTVHFAEWEMKMNDLSKEITDLHRKISQGGEVERQKIVARAMDESERIKKQTQLIAEQEIKKARIALKKEVVDLSLDLAEKILRKTTQPQDQERLVKDYIGKVRELR